MAQNYIIQQTSNQLHSYTFNNKLNNILGLGNYNRGSQQNAWFAQICLQGLILKGYYLQKLNTPCITSDYLLGVILDKLFSCKQSEIKVGYLIKKATKIDLYRELQQIIGQEKDLGFTSEKLPYRESLINVLQYVSPNHHYFFESSTTIIRGFAQQDIQKLKGLDTSLFRTTKLRFFKSTLEQRIQGKSVKFKHQIQKLQTQLTEDKKKQTNKIGKLQYLDTQLKEVQQLQYETNRYNQTQQTFQNNFNLQEEVFTE